MRAQRPTWVLALTATLAMHAHASAQAPMAPIDPPPTSGPDSIPAVPEPAPEPPPAEGVRTEVAGFPAVAANSQYGFVVGASGSVTRYAAGYSPFLMRAQMSAAVSMRGSDTGFTSPLQNVDLRVDMPGRGAIRARIFLLARFTHVLRAGYFGIGNGAGSVVPSDYLGPRDRYFFHERSVAEVRAFARLRLMPHLEAVMGGSARWVKPVPYEDSLLARDVAEAEAGTHAELHGYSSQGLLDGLVGLLVDYRDDELNPTRGGYHELSVRAGGGPAREGPLSYVSLTLHLRFFVPLAGEKLVLAMRAVADVGGGAMPLIELGTIGGYAAFAGTAGPEGNRGLAPGRQLGRIKLLGSVELRSTFAHFRVKKQRLGLGAAAFVDASRVEMRRSKPSEPNGPVFRPSFGGGIRLLWGSAFVFRIDVGVAPRGGMDDRTSVQATAILNQAF